MASIDAYRGLVMTLMMAEVLHLGAVARSLPESDTWRFLAHHQEHVPWVGATLHDLIQPSFSFLVGVALPFSLASRRSRGQSRRVLWAHALWRSLVLVLLGIYLRSIGHKQTNYTFEDTLTQIGLGYPFLFFLGGLSRRVQWAALGSVLLGYWIAFVAYPTPGAGFDYQLVGVPADWPHHATGLAAHWNKNSNLAWAFDRWFLNRLPRERPFLYNGGGYATLSFIPTLGTMILGLLAGGVLHEGKSIGRRLGWLVAAGCISLAAGLFLGEFGVCPVVKRVWTPSWVLFSGGWCFLILAAWYALLDVAGVRSWSYPLRVVGRNSIAAYLMSWLFERPIGDALHVHLGHDLFRVLGEPYEPLMHGAAILAVLWFILYWMDRRGIYLRI